MDDFPFDWGEPDAGDSVKTQFETQVFQRIQTALDQLHGVHPDFDAIGKSLVEALAMFRILRASIVLGDSLLADDDPLSWPTDTQLNATQGLETVLRLRSVFQMNSASPVVYLRSVDLDNAEHYLEQVALTCTRYVIQTRMTALLRQEAVAHAQNKARQDIIDAARKMFALVAQHERLGNLSTKAVSDVVQQSLIAVTLAQSMFAVTKPPEVGDRVRLGQNALERVKATAHKMIDLAIATDPLPTTEQFEAVLEDLRFIAKHFDPQKHAVPTPLAPKKRATPVPPTPKKRTPYAQGMLLGLY